MAWESDLTLTSTEKEVLRHLRDIKSGKVGPVGGEAHRQTTAEIIRLYGIDQQVPEACKGPPAAATPAGQE
eukprot:5230941-Heterocapsa_arctica.AAC.1